MPLYEYQCVPCDQQVERLQKHSDAAPTCTKCSKAMTKKVSMSSFSLQGVGWAKDNYGLKGSKAK